MVTALGTTRIQGVAPRGALGDSGAVVSPAQLTRRAAAASMAHRETASLRDSLKVYVIGSTLSSLSLLTPQPFPSAPPPLGMPYQWRSAKRLNSQELDELYLCRL